ncbi:MAG: DNA-formamidopyrimidine glycosylase [Desulfuromonas sp.]|nr:MAG: DNA-formamidopyrimidine glycosylase [Desulfuromonas sp.]
MPELPEVETTLRGIKPHVAGQCLRGAVVRVQKLRWPVPPNLSELVAGQTVDDITRRGKYLLLHLTGQTLMLHLGMSGSLRIVPDEIPVGKHDHVDLLLDGKRLRLTDPRKFGAVLLLDHDPYASPLLAGLGVEPLSAELTGDGLRSRARGRFVAIKNFIMDQKVVVGVGNIYASEALFRSGINPLRACNSLDSKEWNRLVGDIRHVLTEAIAAGGTTLQDFTGSDGRPGYFRQELRVYGREGEPCSRCGAAIVQEKIGQRSSFFCPDCQK